MSIFMSLENMPIIRVGEYSFSYFHPIILCQINRNYF